MKERREFVNLLGKERIDDIEPQGDLFAPAVSFNY